MDLKRRVDLINTVELKMMGRSSVCFRDHIWLNAFEQCVHSLSLSVQIPPLHSSLHPGAPVLFSIYGSSSLWSILSEPWLRIGCTFSHLGSFNKNTFIWDYDVSDLECDLDIEMFKKSPSISKCSQGCKILI